MALIKRIDSQCTQGMFIHNNDIKLWSAYLDDSDIRVAHIAKVAKILSPQAFSGCVG